MVRNTKTPPPMPPPSPEPPRARTQWYFERPAVGTPTRMISGRVVEPLYFTLNITADHGKIVGQASRVELLVEETGSSCVERVIFYGRAEFDAGDEFAAEVYMAQPTHTVDARELQLCRNGRKVRTYKTD